MIPNKITIIGMALLYKGSLHPKKASRKCPRISAFVSIASVLFGKGNPINTVNPMTGSVLTMILSMFFSHNRSKGRKINNGNCLKETAIVKNNINFQFSRF
jgi:hypothetical protein